MTKVNACFHAFMVKMHQCKGIAPAIPSRNELGMMEQYHLTITISSNLIYGKHEMSNID